MVNPFLKLAKRRRSVRCFSNRKVPFSLLVKLFEAARWAPSACNQQPWLFVAVDDRNLLNRLAPYSTKKILWGPVAVFCFTNNTEKRENFDNIQSTAAAIQNVLLQATELGLGATWIAGFSAKKEDHLMIKKILGVPREYLLQALLAIGSSKGEPPIPYRQTVSSFLYRNRAQLSHHSASLGKEWSLGQQKEYLEKMMSVYLTRFYQTYEFALEKRLISLLPKKGLVIDCNSFYGTYQKKIPLGLKRQLLMTNLSFQAANFLFQKIPAFGSIVASPGRLPIKAKVADCCTVLETVNHFSLPEVIKEAKRTLKVKGKLILLVKQKFSLAYWIYQAFALKFRNAYHQPMEYVRGPCYYYTPNQIRRHLRDFVIEKELFISSQRKWTGLFGFLVSWYKTLFADYFILVARKL